MTGSNSPTALEAFALSPQQRRAWMMQQAGAPLHAICVTRISGELRLEALKDSLDRVIARHETLRTAFVRLPGVKTPVQALSTGRAVWESPDLSGLDKTRQEESLEEIVCRELNRPVGSNDMCEAHAVLLSFGGQDHRLVLSVPALCADSWSLRNVVRDLSLYYSQAAPEEEPVQYVQFSEWQNDLIEADDEDASVGRAFWQKVAMDLPPTPALVGERPAAGGDSYALSSIDIELDGEIFKSLNTWCDAEEVSVDAALAACWCRMLNVFSGQSGVVVWHESSGRKFPEIYDSVGLFALDIPLPFLIEENEPFRKAVRRMDSLMGESVAVQEYWDPDRVASNEITDEPGYGFVSENDNQQTGTGFCVERTCCSLKPYKLRLNFVQGEHPKLTLQYDSQRYDHASIRALAESFHALQASALHSPDSALGSLNVLPASERRRVLEDWNSTDQSFADVPSVHALFEEWALRTPDAPALVFEDQSLTYRELDARANQLAHYLKKRGVGPDVLVGLFLSRSLEMIVGLLGILKAGGAYVALDPSLPSSRLSGMLEDSGVKLVVTHSSVSALVSGCDLVQLDTDWSEISQESVSSLPSTDLVSHPAYVIYTSGSTGKPKGVVIEHGQLLNYVQGVSSRLGLPAGSSYASVSTLSADLGNTCVYGSLCTGGVLHVISETRSMDPSGWRSYLSTHKIDCLKIVPSHLSALLGSDATQQSLPEQVLVLGGEASSWDLISRIHSLSSSVRVLNHYGPTETTVGVLTYAVSRGEDGSGVGGVTVPLGSPLPNSRVYVLNSELSPVPVGVAGELYIGGAGVGRGYLGREDLTKERFVADPFNNKPGSRMYKTGDVVRWLSSGVLEFLGRSDDQVKVRGFRIELGEIESVLLSHVSVRSCVVLAREASSGERRLVAYVVCEGDAPGSGVLKEHLRSELPEYMVPSDVVYLKRLPLTSNGKVDRNALPSPEDVSEGSSYVGPRTSVEEVLCGIWCELLGRDRVSVDDSFFDLGGHSLLATQVVSRVRETFAVDVPLRALLEAPTVEGLAQRIEELQRAGEGLQFGRLEPVSRDGDLPLSFSQQRLWFIDQLEPGSNLYNVPRVLRLRGRLDVESLQKALEEIVRRHEILRTTYASKAGQPVQVISDQAEFPLPVVELDGDAGPSREARVQDLAREEAMRPFDLSCDRPIRGRLLRIGLEEHILLLTLHHIASDGWSHGVLMSELSELYNAFQSGSSSPLPDLSVQYADYASWQRRYLSGEVLDRQLMYWRNRLSGAPPVVSLPTDRPRSEATSYRGGFCELKLGPNVATGLHSLCRSERATPFMVLLSAYKVLLYHLTGQSDLVVGTDLANRTQSETEQLIGFFLNHLVLRTDLSGDPSFRELVRRVRETSLGAYSHQNVPFDKLVEILQPERNLTHTPIFQVLFVLENFSRRSQTFEGLDLEQMNAEFSMSKFDLSLFVQESSDGLKGSWVYRTDLFEPSSVERISTQFTTLLTQLLQEPDRPIEDVKMHLEEDLPDGQATETVRPGALRGARRRVAAADNVEAE